MAKEIVVYYSPYTTVERQALGHLIYPKPIPLQKELRLHKVQGESAWMICNAFRESFSNTFIFNHPVDVDVKFDGEKVTGKNADWVRHRPPSFENSISFDLDYGWLFFCEEDLEFISLPPIFQNNELPKYGMQSAGGFNIARWFRPLHPTYFLWEGISEYKCFAGEPWMYFKAFTDRPVVFKPFFMTERLLEIAGMVSSHPKNNPMVPLSKRYESFKESRLRSVILKDIKENLLEEDSL
jgi:hypothetical protein